MKICVTSEGNNLDSFIVIETDTLEFEAIPNPNIEATGGAGIQSAQLVASKQIKAVLTGNVGPNAFQTLNAAGIDIYTGVSGSVKEAIEAYKSGKLKKTESPSVGSKFGMGK